MERLTDPGYIPERVVSNMTNEQMANIYEKLCRYESTEIEPNQICEIMAHNTALIERLADYEEAEKKGLLINLPCKIGDKVYIVGGSYRQGIYEYWINTGKFKYRDLEQINKTVFTTKEAAEAALKKIQEGE